MNEIPKAIIDVIDIEADEPLSDADSREADRLLTLAEELNLTNGDLIDAVHDAASRYASDACNTLAVADEPLGDDLHEEAGRQAAQINNDGLDHQIRYLVAQWGADEAERLIRDASA